MAARNRATTILVIFLLVGSLTPAIQAGETDVVGDAIAAMGGEALTEMVSFRTHASGTRWVLDEGPYPGSGASAPGPYSTTTSVDVTGDSQRLDTELVSYFVFPRTIAEVITPGGGFVDGQDNNFAPPFAAPMLSDRWTSTRLHQRLMNPHLLLLDAVADPSSISVDGSRLVYDTGGSPLYLAFNRHSGLPSTAWTVESDPLRRDVRMAVRYGRWTEIDGVMFPMRVIVRYGDEVVQREIRSSVDVNPDLDATMFDFPDGVTPTFDPVLEHRGIVRHQHLQSFAALGFPRDGFQPFVSGTEIAPGVHFLAGGSHNSLAVVQEGGVTLVEAPLDEIRADAIADWVESNIGLPITYVVPSHHHADHSAALRHFVGSGATPVVHEEAESFFRAVFRARSDVVPDGVDIRRRVPVVTVPDDGSYIVADTVNPVAVHTVESEHASDLVLVEANGVLFVVDIYNPGLPVTPEADPIVPRVEELGLDIDLIAGGHGGVIAWDEFVALFP